MIHINFKGRIKFKIEKLLFYFKKMSQKLEIQNGDFYISQFGNNSEYSSLNQVDKFKGYNFIIWSFLFSNISKIYEF